MLLFVSLSLQICCCCFRRHELPSVAEYASVLFPKNVSWGYLIYSLQLQFFWALPTLCYKTGYCIWFHVSFCVLISSILWDWSYLDNRDCYYYNFILQITWQYKLSTWSHCSVKCHEFVSLHTLGNESPAVTISVFCLSTVLIDCLFSNGSCQYHIAATFFNWALPLHICYNLAFLIT